MNAKQLQYAVALSEVRNFSQVAEQLNMSQPALSKQILALEKELGVTLFKRGVPLKLTPAGEYFIREAREMLFREDQVKRALQEYKSDERGQLTIGISPFRSLYLIPPLAKALKEAYPNIRVCLREFNSDTLKKEVADGQYDFAIINLPVDEAILDVQPLEQDTLVLAVPNALLEDTACSKLTPFSEIDIADCRDLPFIVVDKNLQMRILFEKLCAAADIRPEIAMEVVGVTTAWAMCRAGIGATLLPYQFIRDYDLDGQITLFKIKNAAPTRQPAIITRRGQYLSPYAKYAIELLKSHSAK